MKAKYKDLGLTKEEFDSLRGRYQLIKNGKYKEQLKNKKDKIKKLKKQLDQQKAMWQDLKAWLEKAILRNKDNIISKNDYENVLVIMQELAVENGRI